VYSTAKGRHFQGGKRILLRKKEVQLGKKKKRKEKKKPEERKQKENSRPTTQRKNGSVPRRRAVAGPRKGDNKTERRKAYRFLPPQRLNQNPDKNKVYDEKNGGTLESRDCRVKEYRGKKSSGDKVLHIWRGEKGKGRWPGELASNVNEDNCRKEGKGQTPSLQKTVSRKGGKKKVGFFRREERGRKGLAEHRRGQKVEVLLSLPSCHHTDT